MIRFFKKFVTVNPFSITFYLTLIVVVLFIQGVPLFELIEWKTFDLRFEGRGIQEPTPVVALAVIDEKSLEMEGRWPWPRAKFAKLIDILSKDGARVVGFDIGFLEPDENTSLQVLNQLDAQIQKLDIKNQELIEFLQSKKINADNDLVFANALQNSEARVVLGHFFYMSKHFLGYEFDDEEVSRRLNTIQDSRYPMTIYEEPDIDLDYFIFNYRAYAPQPNIDILSQAAASSGFFNFEPDPDGIVRKVPLVVKCGEELYSPISVQCVWQYLDQPQMMLGVAINGIIGVMMGDLFIPTEEDGNLLINYLGPERTFPHYSITDIINEKFEKGTFQDKIILVGGTAIGLGDIRMTPFSSSGEYPGMEVHANIIDNMLTGNFLAKPKWTQIYDVMAILILGFFTGIVMRRLGAILGLLVAAGLFVGHVLVSQWLFNNYSLWVNLVYPLLALLVVYMALTMYRYLIEEKNKRFLHSTFSSYLSPELIEEMVSSETMPELGGEARIVTAYFTDIQSFSVFSEKLTAAQLVELLNEYLSAMTDLLIVERGTLDKYEGDAIVAFLGAPIDIPDHAVRACRVAVSMQNTLLDLRNKWRQEKLLPDEPARNIKNLSPEEWASGDKWPKVVHDMRMRIGINTGDIVVGNMGSSVRMNYTMMGDAVNLAARLEEGAKQYGIFTAASEYTLESEYLNEKGETARVWDAVEARFIDRITVVGRTEPVKVYELCALKGGLSDNEKELFSVFDKGMQHYINMEWDAAMDCFKESRSYERNPDAHTTPSDVFYKRCELFKDTPPVPSGEKWDGVYRLTEK